MPRMRLDKQPFVSYASLFFFARFIPIVVADVMAERRGFSTVPDGVREIISRASTDVTLSDLFVIR